MMNFVFITRDLAFKAKDFAFKTKNLVLNMVSFRLSQFASGKIASKTIKSTANCNINAMSFLFSIETAEIMENYP